MGPFCATLLRTARVGSGQHWPMPRLSRRVWIGYAAVWLVYAVILRNLPWARFTWFNIPNLT